MKNQTWTSFARMDALERRVLLDAQGLVADISFSDASAQEPTIPVLDTTTTSSPSGGDALSVCSFVIGLREAGSEFDVDRDGYAQSYYFSWIVSGSGCYTKVYARRQDTGADFSLGSHAAPFYFDADSYSLSHGIYDFRFELYDSATNTLQQTWTKANNASLGSVKVELRSEDPLTPLFLSASVNQRVDLDGDGYNSRFGILFQVDTGFEAIGNWYMKVYEYDGGVGDDYLFTTPTFTAFPSGTDAEQIKINPDDFPGPDLLSHGTVDFKLELYEASQNRLTDTWTPANSANLGNFQVELSREEISPLVGDINFDRRVTIADFITLAANFGKSPAIWADGDLNGDSVVSIADFIDLAAHFNQSLAGSAAPSSSPEPALSTATESNFYPSALLASADPLSRIRPSKSSRHSLHHHRRPRALVMPIRY